jgi:hypothetical protein
MHCLCSSTFKRHFLVLCLCISSFKTCVLAIGVMVLCWKTALRRIMEDCFSITDLLTISCSQFATTGHFFLIIQLGMQNMGIFYVGVNLKIVVQTI